MHKIISVKTVFIFLFLQKTQIIMKWDLKQNHVLHTAETFLVFDEVDCFLYNDISPLSVIIL